MSDLTIKMNDDEIDNIDQYVTKILKLEWIDNQIKKQTQMIKYDDRLLCCENRVKLNNLLKSVDVYEKYRLKLSEELFGGFSSEAG